MEELICKSCGVIDEPIITQHNIHGRKASCKHCGSYIKFLGKERSEQSDFTLWFGKYKGTPISQMDTPEKANYLSWAYQNCDALKDWQVKIIKKRLGV